MVRSNPKVRFTVADYMSTPEGTRYELLDGDMILAPSPNSRHQLILLELALILRPFIREMELGRLWTAPFDVILGGDEVAQPDILFVSNARSGIVTADNIQGAPDLCVEIMSPSTAQYDRGYKLALYGRCGVLEYWVVDPETDSVAIYVQMGTGLVHEVTYTRDEILVSPLLEGLSIELERVFAVE